MTAARPASRVLQLLVAACLGPATGHSQDLASQARAARQRGQPDSACSLIQRAAEAEPSRAEVQFLLGDIACQRAQRIGGIGACGTARKCKAAFARAVQLEPDSIPYLESLIGYLSQAPGIVGGDRDSALALAHHVRPLDESRGPWDEVTVLRLGNDRRKQQADSTRPLPPAGEPRWSVEAAWWRLGQSYVLLAMPDSARLLFEESLRRPGELHRDSADIGLRRHPLKLASANEASQGTAPCCVRVVAGATRASRTLAAWPIHKTHCSPALSQLHSPFPEAWQVASGWCASRSNASATLLPGVQNGSFSASPTWRAFSATLNTSATVRTPAFGESSCCDMSAPGPNSCSWL